MMLDISTYSDLFRRYLCAGWGVFDELLRMHDWDSDPQFVERWVSIVWSKFVIEQNAIPESSVLEYSFPTKKLDALLGKCEFLIICRDVSSLDRDSILIFCEFVEEKDGGVGVYPPLSLIRAIDYKSGGEVILKANQFRLYIVGRSEI